MPGCLLVLARYKRKPDMASGKYVTLFLTVPLEKKKLVLICLTDVSRDMSWIIQSCLSYITKQSTKSQFTKNRKS